MKAMLDDYKIKIAELENINKSLRDQLVAMCVMMKCVCVQVLYTKDWLYVNK